MKIIALILSLLLLTSCSNPDTSGGVTLSRGGGDDANEFPDGACEGQHENTPDLNTGCGWIYNSVRQGYYIKPGADLRGASLDGADLRHANLERAILDSAYMPHVNLRYANLVDAKLWGATLSYANLRYASLRGAKLWGAILWGVDGVHANLTNADLSGAYLRNAEMGGAIFRNANLSGADLRGAWFTGSDIINNTSIDHFADIKANSSTICPNGATYGQMRFPRHDCPF